MQTRNSANLHQHPQVKVVVLGRSFTITHIVREIDLCEQLTLGLLLQTARDNLPHDQHFYISLELVMQLCQKRKLEPYFVRNPNDKVLLINFRRV